MYQTYHIFKEYDVRYVSIIGPTHQCTSDFSRSVYTFVGVLVRMGEENSQTENKNVLKSVLSEKFPKNIFCKR